MEFDLHNKDRLCLYSIILTTIPTPTQRRFADKNCRKYNRQFPARLHQVVDPSEKQL
jgi:hypothetical protein